MAYVVVVWKKMKEAAAAAARQRRSRATDRQPGERAEAGKLEVNYGRSTDNLDLGRK